MAESIFINISAISKKKRKEKEKEEGINRHHSFTIFYAVNVLGHEF